MADLLFNSVDAYNRSLLKGDIITTGTPPGVGAGKKPMPIFLKAGDTMILNIGGLGEQRSRVRNEE